MCGGGGGGGGGWGRVGGCMCVYVMCAFAQQVQVGNKKYGNNFID